MELNAILYRNERALHRLHTRLAAIETRAGAGTGAGAGGIASSPLPSSSEELP